MKLNEIQVVGESQKRDSKIKGVLLNEWEKLAAPSNRRLTHQNLRFLFSLDWSIDRITLVGNLKEFEFEHHFVTEDGEIIYEAGEKFTLHEAMPILAREEAAERAGNGWRLVDKYGENIAYVEILPFKDSSGKEKGRIDFNPNKIEAFLKTDLKSFIGMMFDNPHFSRADVACDILDLPDEYVSQYRLVDAVSYRPYFGQNGALETAYWGARSSERQVRMYNKKLEQEKHRHIVPDEVKSWWRLELQLRRGKADEWAGVVYDTLDSFYSPFHFPDNISFREKAILYGLHAEHSLWNEASENTKRKYRNLAKRVAKEDELTQHLKASFSENIDELKRELETWLGKIKVNEE